MAWRNLRRTASGGTVQDIKLAAAYMLLGQTEWILRRTETVTFTSEGSTRRHIAFDCMLPNNERKWLKWIPDEEPARIQTNPVQSPISGTPAGALAVTNTSDTGCEPRYVGLPVTFLGKGDLINLDVRDGEGNTLHTVGRRDDAVVLIHALENCLYQLDSKDFLLYELNMLALREMRKTCEAVDHGGESMIGDDTAIASFRNDLRRLGHRIAAWCRTYRKEVRDADSPIAAGADKTTGTDDEILTYFGNYFGNPSDCPNEHSADQNDHSSGACCLRYHNKPVANRNSSVKYAVLDTAHNMVVNSSWSGMLRQTARNRAITSFRGLDQSVKNAMGDGSHDEGMDDDVLEGVSEIDTQRIDYTRKALLARILTGIDPNTVRADGNGEWPGRDVAWHARYEASEHWLDEGSGQGRGEYDWCVRALMRFLYIWQGDAKSREEYDALQSYLLLLSSACDTYPFIVLVPIERARNRERLMVKIGFDAGYKESLRQKLDLRNQTIDLAFQTYSARSTHIEVAPAEGIVLTDASEIVSKAGANGGVAGEPAAGAKKSAGGRALMPAKNRASHHMAARIAAGRLHMSTGSREKWPLTHLRLTLMMRRNFIASFAIWSLLTLALNVGLGCVIGIGPWKGLVATGLVSTQVLSFFSAQNVVGAIAVVFTLWVARRISTMQHRVVEGLNSSMTTMMNINLFLFTGLCLVACGGMIGSGDDITGGGWSPVWRWIVAACLVVSLVITGISISAWFEYLRRSVKSDGTFRLATCTDPNLGASTGQDTVMPADRSAFSALEICDGRRRRDAMTALHCFVEALAGQIDDGVVHEDDDRLSVEG